jgi:hypothetical protein
MSDIFISYTRADKERAKLLADAFSGQGWSVWWDRQIPPGKSFDETIENALNSARCVIVLWSKESVSSRWVKTEAAEGAVRGILVPVLIDKVQIPLEFKRIEAADLSDWQGTSPHPEFDHLLKTVASILGGVAPTKVKQTPTNTKLRSRRWWTTKLGLVTATAGIITAVTGLIVALYQTGFLDMEDKSVPQIQNTTITPPEPTKPAAVPGTVPSATKGIVAKVTRFEKSGGLVTLELTLQNTTPDTVSFCLDTYLAALIDEATGKRWNVLHYGGEMGIEKMMCPLDHELAPGKSLFAWMKFKIDAPETKKFALLVPGLRAPVENLVLGHPYN